MIVSAIANGGTLMEPYVIDEVQNTEGNAVEKYEPAVVIGVIFSKLPRLTRDDEGSCREVRYKLSGRIILLPARQVQQRLSEEAIMHGLLFYRQNDQRLLSVLVERCSEAVHRLPVRFWMLIWIISICIFIGKQLLKIL